MLVQLCRRCVMFHGSFLRCQNMSPCPSLIARCLQRRSLCMFRRSFPVNRCLTYSHDFILTQRVCAKHIRWSRTDSTTKSANVEDNYELGYIYVKTSIDRWYETPEGVEFDVGFVDSMPNAKFDSKMPVILGLPSSLGSHRDLMNVLLVFVKLGYRVIIPNMPSSSLCMCRSRSESTVFMNSPDEKAEFVTDFLAELNINKVDMLVTDSDSVYTGLYFCNQNQSKVKAFAMINPTGLDYTKFMLPVHLFSLVNKMWEEVFFAQSLVWGMFFVLKLFTRKRHLAVNQFITLSKTVMTLDFKQILEEAEAYRGDGVATLALYRDDCEQLTRCSTEELLHSMGVEEPSITVYDQHDHVATQGIRDSNQWGVLFQGDVGDIKETKAKLVRTKLLDFYKNYQKAEQNIRPLVRRSEQM